MVLSRRRGVGGASVRHHGRGGSRNNFRTVDPYRRAVSPGGSADFTARLIAQKLFDSAASRSSWQPRRRGMIGNDIVASRRPTAPDAHDRHAGPFASTRAFSKNALRPRQGFRARHADRIGLAHPVATPFAAGQKREGPRRARARPAGAAHVRVERHRQRHASNSELSNIRRK